MRNITELVLVAYITSFTLIVISLYVEFEADSPNDALFEKIDSPFHTFQKRCFLLVSYFK